MYRAFFWTLLPALAGQPVAGADELFDLKRVAEGVYAAIAKPAYKVNCNAAIILLPDGVMVVDTHSKPSAARGLIQQIRSLTDKPVRWVVDTHFHWDHYQGNEAYPSAWPEHLEIISSEATRENIRTRGIPRVKHETVAVPREIERLKADLSRATVPGERARLEDERRQAEAYLAELKAMQVTLPTLTFERSLILHREGRSVQILWLGRAHTEGDVVVYLPNERVLVTGDLIHGWMPYMGDAYPYDWIRTLEEAEKLDFEHVIPGHGDVLRGKETFRLWRRYLRDLMAETAEAYASGASLEEAVRSVSSRLEPNYASRFPEGAFARSASGNIQKAYRVVSGAQQ